MVIGQVLLRPVGLLLWMQLVRIACGQVAICSFQVLRVLQGYKNRTSS